jgi:hypothetical protein
VLDAIKQARSTGVWTEREYIDNLKSARFPLVGADWTVLFIAGHENLQQALLTALWLLASDQVHSFTALGLLTHKPQLLTLRINKRLVAFSEALLGHRPSSGLSCMRCFVCTLPFRSCSTAKRPTTLTLTWIQSALTLLAATVSTSNEEHTSAGLRLHSTAVRARHPGDPIPWHLDRSDGGPPYPT